MPQAHKVLGQAAPADTSNANIYTAGTGVQAIVSTITVANITGSAATFRIACRPAAAAVANQHWIAYDASVPANDSLTLTLGISLAATDVLTVRSGTANAIAFSVFGVEIT
jgi:hypothetical protein